MQPVVSVSVGTDDNEGLDRIYADIILEGNLALSVYESEETIDGMDEYSFLQLMGKVFNRCILVAKQLHLHIKVCESVEESAEEVEDGLFNRLLKEYDWSIKV